MLYLFALERQPPDQLGIRRNRSIPMIGSMARGLLTSDAVSAGVVYFGKIKRD